MNIGVVGLGFMGSVHLDAWSRVPGARLVAVADPKPQRCAGDFSDVQGNLGGAAAPRDFTKVHAYASAESLLADPEVEAVDICLPTNLHLPVTLAALQAGKHVLVEKPMALTATECDVMIDAARQARRVLMVAQVIRFWPDYAKAREIYCAGGIGLLRGASLQRRCAAPGWGRWLPDPRRSGGGIFDLLIHDVDYCQQLLGRPASVSAAGLDAVSNGLDWVTARLEYPLGVAVSISGGWYNPGPYPFSMDFTLLGETGTLEFHSIHRRLTHYPSGGAEQSPELSQSDPYEAEIRYFLECAQSGRWPDRCAPEDSAAAVLTMCAIQDSRRHGGEKIPL